MNRSDVSGEWWEPIETAPKNDTRVMLAFAAVDRPRRPLEPKAKKGKNKDWIRRRASITIGRWRQDCWVPGRSGAFFDQPTHWMHLPDLPDELTTEN